MISRIRIFDGKIDLSAVFAGQNVGVKQVSDRIWLVSFMDYDLGYFDDETCRQPIENPFSSKALPMSLLARDNRAAELAPAALS